MLTDSIPTSRRRLTEDENGEDMQLSHEKRLTYRQIYSSEISFGFYLLVLLWVHFPSSDRSTVLCVRRPRLCDGRGVGRASAIDGESTGGRRASAASRVPVNVVRGRPCEVQRVARARLDRPRSGWCARPAASAARWAAARASFNPCRFGVRFVLL